MSSSSQNSEEQRSPIPNPPCSSPEDLPLPGGNGRTDVALEPKLITVKDEPAAMGTSQQAQIQQAQIQQAQIQQAQIQQAQIQQAQIQQANIHKAALFPSLDVTSLPIASSSLNPSSEDDQSRLEGRSSQSEHPSRAGAPSAPVEISSARSASLPPLVESVLDRTTAAIYPSVESIESQWTPTRAEARRVHVSQHRTRLIKIVNATYAVCRSEELDEEARDLCRTVHQIAGDPSFYIPAPESDFFMLRSMIDETDAARTAIGFQEHFKFPGRSDEVPCIVVDMGTITGLNFEEGGTW